MPPVPESVLLEHAATLIGQADALVVAAGAGMGVDSGLPDFRSNEGFWRSYPALGRAHMEFSRIASPQAFRDDPALAWGFYGHRLGLYRATTPHAGFGLLKRWGERMPLGYGVFTSNVDGHFQKAGFDPLRVFECHGSIHQLQCLAPCSGDIWSAAGFVPEVDQENCRLLNAAPRCPDCGGLARPNILMFGDWDWNQAHAQVQQQRLLGWLAAASRPLVVELGAGTAIASVRDFSERVLELDGGRLIRINPRESAVLSARDVGLAMGSAAALAAIDALLAPAGANTR
ncbi:Sir2 family NAD-dependent protein deacetylase [Rugamonas sp. DEMB1]|uniref:SIR2 family NAD-dependent protein deacylase n=1 Tax=Rugamonas sp. DEMB1 TaxID=3039386 RepID=UPI0024481145|nr:Sir2 family NAD-dependent protein deacetylase [Rugamonas sp. DEMB1]WGG51940.1 Sir2 family NAD-dependent protein deacetylase [Rugamonas sp. DEMB1]